MKRYNKFFLKEYLNEQNQKQELITFFIKLLAIILTISATITILLTLIFPIIKFNNAGIANNFNNNDYAVCIHQDSYAQGDQIIFNYGNLHLCKRVIACGGDTIDITDDNKVYVNSRELKENYLISDNMKKGEYEDKYPYKVPEGYYYVLNDDRENTNDSRNNKIQDIDKDTVIGKILFKIPNWSNNE